MDIADKKLIAETIAKYFTMIQNIKQLNNATTAVKNPKNILQAMAMSTILSTK